MIRVPDAVARWRSRAGRPWRSARSRMLPRPWWSVAVRTRARAGSKPAAVVLDPEHEVVAARGPATSATRVAPAWRATLDSASRAMNSRSERRSGGRSRRRRRRRRRDPPRGRPRRASPAPRRAARGPPTGSSGPLAGRSRRMYERMSAITRLRASIARSIRATASSRPASSSMSSEAVLERQAHGVDGLDDPVVEVLADPLALLHDRQPLDLVVQPGVLDRDAGMDARTSRPGARRRRVNGSPRALSVRYRLPTTRPLTGTGTPRNDVIGGWLRREAVRSPGARRCRRSGSTGPRG